MGVFFTSPVQQLLLLKLRPDRHLNGVSSHQGLVYDTSLEKAKYSGLHADRTGLSSLPGLRYFMT